MFHALYLNYFIYMTTAEINQKKRELIDWINRLSDETVIELLEGLKSSEGQSDWWDTLSVKQKQRLQAGLDDIENGHLVSSAAFWKAIKNA